MSGPALVWGIKQSLRNYVADGGEITLTDDAVESAAGYVFPSTDRHPDGALAFRGRVEFSAYGGLLCFVVADPVLDAERSTLTVLGRDGKRVAAAELTSHGTDFATVLAASGAGLFDGMYPAGTALDPILLTATAPMKRPVHGDDTHALPDRRPRPPIPTPSRPTRTPTLTPGMGSVVEPPGRSASASESMRASAQISARMEAESVLTASLKASQRST